VVAGGRRSDLLRLVEAADLVLRELAHPVVAALYDFVAVHLEDVSEALVDEKPSDRKLRVERNVEDVLRIAAQDQLAGGGLDRELIHLGLIVDRERVVHVEADERSSSETQVAIDEDASRALDPSGRAGRDGVVERQDKLLECHANLLTLAPPAAARAVGG
jgi:vacuolar-type H+-ATPase subunit I/STV1